jgi:uracil-DNA glycosylase
MKSFILSNECNKIYNFLKSAKDDIIYPKSVYTFRPFKYADLEQTRAVVIFKEPYNDIEPDGIPLSCTLGHKVHPMLNTFHDAMEDEFYGLNLDILKDHNLDHIIKQDILLINADLTVFRNKPGSHYNLWKKFTGHVIKILTKRNIPIMFIGEDVCNRFKHLLPPIYPYFLVEKGIEDHLHTWRPNGKFKQLNSYIYENTDFNDVMWVDMDVPF